MLLICFIIKRDYQMKPKIIVVAPSESIAGMCRNVTSKCYDADFEIKVANLTEAVNIISSFKQDFDVIIARGRTAAMLRESTEKPIIEIPVSAIDVLSAIQQAKNFHVPFAVVSFSNTTFVAQKIRDIFQLDLDIFTLGSLEEAETLMPEIRGKGYQLIVSGMGFDHIARRYGINSVLISTGIESIASSINEAILIGKEICKVKSKVEELSVLLAGCSNYFLVCDTHGKIFTNTTPPDLNDFFVNRCLQLLPNAKQKMQLVSRIKDNYIYDISFRTETIGTDNCVVFTCSLKQKIPISRKSGITSYSKEDAWDRFLVHFPQFSNGGRGGFGVDLQRLGNISTPLFLTGEEGTGKEQVAALLYEHSDKSEHPFFVIECGVLQDKEWLTLLNGSNFLFNEKHSTILFRHLETVSMLRLKKLASIIMDSMLSEENRLFFAFDLVPGTHIPQIVIDFVDEIGCLWVDIPPLRMRISDLHDLINLYINTMNIEYGKQVIGLTEEGEKLMLEYQWPYNLNQFKRVIATLVMNSSSAYIQKEQVEQALAVEKKHLSSAAALASVIDVNQKMDDIEKEIAQAVLKKTHGNQSQAAKLLGISRTTFWRLTKK